MSCSAPGALYQHQSFNSQHELQHVARVVHPSGFQQIAASRETPLIARVQLCQKLSISAAMLCCEIGNSTALQVVCIRRVERELGKLPGAVCLQMCIVRSQIWCYWNVVFMHLQGNHKRQREPAAGIDTQARLQQHPAEAAFLSGVFKQPDSTGKLQQAAEHALTQSCTDNMRRLQQQQQQQCAATSTSRNAHGWMLH